MSAVSSRAYDESISLASRPRWYISRGPGLLVPLVPTDELPAGLDLLDAPRHLTQSEALKMIWLAEVAPTGRMFVLESQQQMCASEEHQDLFSRHETSAVEDSQRPEETDRAETTEGSSAGIRLRDSPRATPCSRHEASSTMIASKHAAPEGEATRPLKPSHVVGPTRRPLPPSGVEPNQLNKVYCSYWIRTGECDYTQTGCFYKHEMPDIQTLNDIGFRQVPRWYLDQQALKRLAAAPRGGRSGKRWTRGARAAITDGPTSDRPRERLQSDVDNAAQAIRRLIVSSQPRKPTTATLQEVPPSPRPLPPRYRNGSIAEEEPLIVLDYPSLVPSSGASSPVKQKTPTSRSSTTYQAPLTVSEPLAPTILSSSETVSGSSALPTGQNSAAEVERMQPVFRFTYSTPIDTPERAALEETNMRMEQAARRGRPQGRFGEAIVSRLDAEPATVSGSKTPADNSAYSSGAKRARNRGQAQNAKSAARRRVTMAAKRNGKSNGAA